jgi:hypothetical protein
MTHRLKKYYPLLKKIKSSGLKKRNEIIENASDELVLCLCDLAKNTLNNAVPLSKVQFKKLSLHKRILRKLVSKKVNVKKKKKAILSQGGGFLVPLIAPIIAAVVQGLIFQ